MKAISLLIFLIACSSKAPQDPITAIEVPLIGKHPGIRECYMNTSEYIKNPGSEAQVKVEFDVRNDGSTADHKIISSSVQESRFQKCIISSLRTLKYPPQNETFIVEQSFTLTPGKK